MQVIDSDPPQELTTQQTVAVRCVDGYSSNGLPAGPTEGYLQCHNDASVSVHLQCQVITHTIEGWIIDAQNGEPVEDAVVTITNALGVESQARTDDHGWWRVDDAPRGETSLVIVHAQYITADWSFSVTGDIEGGSANQAISRIL